ncbi:MAG TPA: mechanosensitive ion channel family protein [Verrucomicrobiae bacterium]|nr:mechanosensitive ion channel family protein [Verrucomicrobiae bacterium]
MSPVRTIAKQIWLFVAAIVLAAAVSVPVVAQEAAPAAEPPAKVQELLKLLDDPAVREWLAQHQSDTSAAQPTPPNAPAEEAMGPSSYFAGRVAAIREHMAGLVAALPTLPDEFERAGIILGLEFQERGLIKILLLIAVFVGLGFGAERLFYWIAKGIEVWIMALPLDTVVQRLRAIAVRLAYGIGMVTSFAIGSVGGFLALDWPPLLREIVLGYLLAFLVLRLTLVAARFILSPGGERFRILPMSTEAAWFWTKRLGLFVGWLAFGWVTVGLLATLGMGIEARRLLAYALGLVLLVIALESIWRHPVEPPAVRSRAKTWLLSAFAVALWLLWVVSAMPTFWLLVVVVALPFALRLTQRAVDHLLRPPGAAAQEESTPGVIAASLARGLRALIIIGAALLLAWAWQLDFGALTAQDTWGTRLLRGGLNAVVIVLLADFAWHVLKALIDRKLEGARNPGPPNTEEARRGARLRTLLPIVRNVLFVVLLVMALLMSLSSLGIEIGPLIAGAGVVGVAIGFGAQTLVKDIISGMFFLLDDAFRVGEYIQSGSYKGTVESFSIRSIKLRHHRGPLYTVPFGELGAVQNMSRDWVIDKLSISITYDSDFDKAKKLIKQIGKQLLEDPEFAPHFLAPLKMQGVEQFGDYGIQIRMKMMTKPGEQFVIRRKAYALIKKAFDENGIHFASPTVTVSDGDPAGAAAQRIIAAKAAAVEE